jgi:hypothetical protein
MPCGEAIGFYPNGIGLHEWYSGFSCSETYFEWKPAGDFLLHIRPYDPADEWMETSPEDPESIVCDEDGWISVPFSIETGTYYDSPKLHLRFGVLTVNVTGELWYSGATRDGPTSNWPRGRRG